jgi:LmbE family N-acetylglucosaminyl deacetylase
MNKAEDKAMSSRPSIIRVIGASLAMVLIALLAVRHDGSAAANQNAPLVQRNQAIIHLMQLHRTQSLVAGSSRLLSLKGQTGVKLIEAEQSCTGLHRLSTTALTNSFAYLLDSPATNRHDQACQYAQVVDIFGQPSSRAIIAGSMEKPTEQMLFYDQGVVLAHDPKSPQPAALPAAPGADHLVPLSDVTATDCPGHKTILQIAAHEDDDLLFMNPDMWHSIQAGDCVRTVYLTAGDAGSSKFYWLGRERGSEAAYAWLGGFTDIWTDTSLKIGDHRFAAMATPLNESRYSLIFMRLPDGRPDGMGFVSSGFESLTKLASGQQKTMHSVDDQSTFSDKELVAALSGFMNLYQPDEVRSQLPYNHSTVFGDHSDHMTTGKLVTDAFKHYRQQHPSTNLSYYTGYPIREQPANVDGDDLTIKEQAFFMYAQYDGAVCGSMDVCLSRGDYGEYLQRQYRINY